MIPFNNEKIKQLHKLPDAFPAPDMLQFLLEDIRAHGDEEIIPDMTGADYFFVRYFVTEEMRWDFDRIEADFMKHCYDKLPEFGRVEWYTQTGARYSDPKSAHIMTVTGLILNGAKSGDEYCRALIRYLFKTYYKPVYKQLKRFHRISADEALSLSECGSDIPPLAMASIILIMCSIENIEFQEDIPFLCRLINRNRSDSEADNERDAEFLGFQKGLFDECRAQVKAWTEEDAKAHPDFIKQNKVYWKEDDFTAACLKHFGYPEDYIARCLDNYLGFDTEYTRTLAVLRTAFPKREFTFEDVQRYAHLYSAIAALTDVSEVCDDISHVFLGPDEEDELWQDETLFHPENIKIPAAAKPGKETKPVTIMPAAIKDNTDKEALLAEIEELRNKLTRKQTEYSQLKSRYALANTARKEAEQLLKEYENDRSELIALRDFVYRLEQEVPEVRQLSVDDMKKEIAGKSYVIIGGHVNWINKLKQEFPDWTYILPSAYRTVDAESLENKDKLFFFSDHISHAAYYKFIAAARERRIPFSYLHAVNTEQIIRQIYEGGKKDS